MKTGQVVLEVISNSVCFIILSLSFFSLLVTVSSNAIEQIKEVAILRCIGFPKNEIVRVWCYGAIIIVLTGGLIGICTGV